jgi:hypothetical protein
MLLIIDQSGYVGLKRLRVPSGKPKRHHVTICRPSVRLVRGLGHAFLAIRCPGGAPPCRRRSMCGRGWVLPYATPHTPYRGTGKMSCRTSRCY